MKGIKLRIQKMKETSKFTNYLSDRKVVNIRESLYTMFQDINNN